MKILDRSLSAWQTGILLFVLLFANKVLVLPELLFEGAKFEAVFIPIVSFLFEIGLLWLFFRLKTRFPNQSFAEILQQNCTNVVKILIYVLFAVFFLAKAVLLYNVTFIFFRNLIYKDSGNFLFLFCLLPVINHLCICGLRTIGRTLQLFFPLILIVSAFCVLVGVFGIGQGPLLFQAGVSQWLTTALKHISPYGDTIFLFLIMDKVQIGKGQWKILFLLQALAAAFVCMVTLVFVLSYTYTCFMHPYALFEIMSFVKEYGGMGRIDIISMALIIIFTYFHLAIYMKAFVIAFDVLLPKINPIYGVLSFNTLFLLIVNFFIINLETAIVYGEKILPYAVIFPFVLLPILIFVIEIVQRHKKNFDFGQKNKKTLVEKRIEKTLVGQQNEEFLMKKNEKTLVGQSKEKAFVGQNQKSGGGHSKVGPQEVAQ